LQEVIRMNDNRCKKSGISKKSLELAIVNWNQQELVGSNKNSQELESARISRNAQELVGLSKNSQELAIIHRNLQESIRISRN